MSKYKFGKFETEFDPTNVAFIKKYETAAEEYNKKIKQIPKDEKASEIMMHICSVFYEVFNSLFGEGTSEKMFGTEHSVDKCAQAFGQLIDIMNDYSKTLKSIQNFNSAPKRKK